MAIVVIFDIPGMTSGQYEQVIKALDAAGAGTPDGRIYHVASTAENGWQVVDVWESEEKVGQFAETMIPILAQAGVTPPEPKISSVHTIIE